MIIIRRVDIFFNIFENRKIKPQDITNIIQGIKAGANNCFENTSVGIFKSTNAGKEI